MKVAKLIELLRQMPADAPVLLYDGSADDIYVAGEIYHIKQEGDLVPAGTVVIDIYWDGHLALDHEEEDDHEGDSDQLGRDA